MTGLTGGWRHVRLADVADTALGKMLDAARPKGALATPYLRNSNVQWGRIDATDVQSVPLSPGERVQFLLEDGDLLVCEGGEIGRAAIWHGGTVEMAYQKALHRVRSRGDLDVRWLRYLLEQYATTGDLAARATGSTIKHLPQRQLRELPLCLPDLAEQRRIVDLLEDHLSRLDAAKASLVAGVQRANALYASHLWGLTHRVEGDRVPLESVAGVRLGRQRSPANHTGDSMCRYLRAANVDWDTLRLDEVKEMNFTANEASRYHLKEGDILLVEASGSPGEVGKSAVYRGEAGTVCFQNTLLRVRCHGVEPAFMQKYLLAEAMNGRFKVGARGVGIHHIGRSRIASWPVVVPTRHDQAAVVEAADELAGAKLRLTAAAQSALAGMTRLRQAVMSAAFAGRL